MSITNWCIVGTVSQSLFKSIASDIVHQNRKTCSLSKPCISVWSDDCKNRRINFAKFATFYKTQTASLRSEYPSCLQITLASLESKLSSVTVPHTPWMHTSTRPRYDRMLVVWTRRTSPCWQSAERKHEHVKQYLKYPS